MVYLGLVLCCLRVSSALVTIWVWLFCCVGVVVALCGGSVMYVCGSVA